MTKFKKLMALAAVSMLGIQMMGVGTALAGPPTVDSDCDFGSDSLEVTLGENASNSERADVTLYIDSDGILHCNSNGNGQGTVDEEQAVSTIDSITVEMDDDDSNANLWIDLADEGTDAAEWPEFDTFDVDITSRLIFDGSGVADGAANKLRVTVGKTTFSFDGTSGTYVAGSLEWADGSDDDVFDASKATVRVYVGGTAAYATPADDGEDVVKGGSGNDKLEVLSSDGVIVYGNGGNDYILTGSGDDQGWGGAGEDTINLGTGTKDTAAPGAGDDDVTAADRVTYADLTEGMTYSALGTGGSAGDDDFTGTIERFTGSAGDDVIAFTGVQLNGGAGDDVLKCNGCDDVDTYSYVTGGAGNDVIMEFGGNGQDNVFYGNAGDDILRGKSGDDTLRGGPGKDQTWGGSGMEDYCAGEITNRCELGRV